DSRADGGSGRRRVVGGTGGAGGATMAVAAARGPTAAHSWRFLTGAALAGVYPPGMKLAAGWFREARGWAIGTLVGALTLGSAAPHLVRWLVAAGAWPAAVRGAGSSGLLGGSLGMG